MTMVMQDGTVVAEPRGFFHRAAIRLIGLGKRVTSGGFSRLTSKWALPSAAVVSSIPVVVEMKSLVPRLAPRRGCAHEVIDSAEQCPLTPMPSVLSFSRQEI